jgi:divalent metal cation (Fe/Co/Zn/Cd) transporter
VESPSPRSLLSDLAVCLYVLGTGTAALFSLGWSSAPREYDYVAGDTRYEALLVGFAVIALVTAWAMARAHWRGLSSRAGGLFVVSLVSLVSWVLTIALYDVIG